MLGGIVGTYTRAGALAAGEGVAVAVAAGERLLDVLAAVERDHQAVCDWRDIRRLRRGAREMDLHKRPSERSLEVSLITKQDEGTDQGRR